MFASFLATGRTLPNDTDLPLSEVIADPTGNIKPTTATAITLQPGYYKINYFVSASLAEAGYLQVTPVYNGAAHLEYAALDNTTTDNELAIMNRSFIIQVPVATSLYFVINGTGTATNANVSLTIEKLNR